MSLLPRLTLGSLLIMSACAPRVTAPRVAPPSCSVPDVPLEETVASTPSEDSLPREDPLENIHKLREGEFVVPDEIFNAYWGSMQKDGTLYRGFTVPPSSSHDPPLLRPERFIEIIPAKYSSEDIRRYITQFTAEGNIVLPERELSGGFQEVLQHERYHQEMNRLPRQELDILQRAQEELLEGYIITFGDHQIVKNGCQEQLMADLLIYPERYSPEMAVEISRFGEFYPYLADGKTFRSWVEGRLQAEHPDAYAIFDKVRTKVRNMEF